METVSQKKQDAPQIRNTHHINMLANVQCFKLIFILSAFFLYMPHPTTRRPTTLSDSEKLFTKFLLEPFIMSEKKLLLAKGCA